MSSREARPYQWAQREAQGSRGDLSHHTLCPLGARNVR